MNIFSIRDLSPAQIQSWTKPKLFADDDHLPIYGTLACLFEQPSLRTASSFAAAGLRSGLTPVFINTSQGNEFRSQTDLDDEILQLTLTGAKCVVVRASRKLDGELFRESQVPIVSGGDGDNEHPTQALTDVLTMRTFGELSGKKIVLMGNAKDHRTIHSLTLALSHFDVEVVVISPLGMDLPERFVSANTTAYSFGTKAERDCYLRNADFVYISPIKFNNNPYLKDEQGVASLNLTEARQVLKKTAKILHPFPRLEELGKDLDFTEYDAYHLQASLGIIPRIRLFKEILSR